MIKGAIVMITTACNLRCKMCNVYNLKPQFIEVDKEFFKGLKKKGIRYLSLTGGQPTLHPELIKLLKTIKDIGFIVHMNTNGSRPEVLAEAVKYLDGLTVSLDHYIPEIHNKIRGRDIYSQAMESIKIAKKSKVKIVCVNAVPMEENYSVVEPFVEFANKELGVALSWSFPENEGEFFNNEFSIDKDKLYCVYEKAYNLYNRYVFGNLRSYYREAMAYLEGKPVSKCKAGDTIRLVDVNRNELACCHHRERIEGCNECFDECYREPSLAGVFESVRTMYRVYRLTKKGIVKL